MSGFVRASCPLVCLVVRLHDPWCVRAALARPFPRGGTEKPLDINSFFFLSENREKIIVISCGCSFLRRRLEKKKTRTSLVAVEQKIVTEARKQLNLSASVCIGPRDIGPREPLDRRAQAPATIWPRETRIPACLLAASQMVE